MSSQSRTHDYILHSLIESGFNPSSLKNIFERGVHTTFAQTLDGYIQKQQQDIQQLCNTHYEDFLEAITKLNDSRDSADALKEKIHRLNAQVQESGQESVASGSKLLMHQRIAENIEKTMEVLRWCRVVSALSVKANQQIAESRFFHALETLSRLEKSLQRVRHFSFAKQLEYSIPRRTQHIKDLVSTQFNNWLNNVKQKAQSIGHFLLKHMKNRMDQRDSFFNESSEYEDEDVFSISQLDFTDVYLCKLIYTRLGASTEFVTYYKKNREVQIDYELRLLPKVSDFAMHHTWLARIVGFFDVEHHILKTTQNLITEVEFKKLWEKTRLKVETQLDLFFSKTTDPAQFLEMKEEVSGFCYTMSNRMRLDVQSLLDLMQKYTEQFSRIVATEAREEMRRIIESESFIPLRVASAEEYAELAKFNLVSTENLEQRLQGIRFPIDVAFSSTVPQICRIIQGYMQRFFKYSQFLTDLDESIKLGLQQVLQDVGNSFDKLIDDTPQGAVGHYAQISVNADYIMRACRFFEEEYTQARRKDLSAKAKDESQAALYHSADGVTSSETTHTSAFSSVSHVAEERPSVSARLNSRGYASPLVGLNKEDLMILEIPRKRFETKRDLAQDRIQKCVDTKIDQLISEGKNWAAEATQHSESTHQFAENLSIYLQSNIEKLSIIPRDRVEDITFQCSARVANGLMSLLLHEELFNMEALRVLRRDVERIKSSLLIYNRNSGHNFSELEQLLDFVLQLNLSKEQLATWNDGQSEQLMEEYTRAMQQEESGDAIKDSQYVIEEKCARLAKVLSKLQHYELLRQVSKAKQQTTPQKKKKGMGNILKKFSFRSGKNKDA